MKEFEDREDREDAVLALAWWVLKLKSSEFDEKFSTISDLLFIEKIQRSYRLEEKQEVVAFQRSIHDCLLFSTIEGATIGKARLMTMVLDWV